MNRTIIIIFFNVFSGSVASRPLLFSKRKVFGIRQNAFNVHNSSAANLRAAKHNNFIFPSSGHKTRAKKVQGDRWQNRRHVPTALDRSVCALGVLLLRVRCVNQNKTDHIRKRDCTKASTMSLSEGRNRDECKPALGPLKGLYRHSLPIGTNRGEAVLGIR